MTSGHVCAKTSPSRRRVNKLIHSCERGAEGAGCQGGQRGCRKPPRLSGRAFRFLLFCSTRQPSVTQLPEGQGQPRSPVLLCDEWSSEQPARSTSLSPALLSSPHAAPAAPPMAPIPADPTDPSIAWHLTDLHQALPSHLSAALCPSSSSSLPLRHPPPCPGRHGGGRKSSDGRGEPSAASA